MKGREIMNRLKELRQEKKLSQKELAKKIGVHYRTLQNWENGESQIKPDKAQALADHFGISVAYLLGYTEEHQNILKENANIQFQNLVKFFRDNFLLMNDDEIDGIFQLITTLSTANERKFIAMDEEQQELEYSYLSKYAEPK